MREINSVQMGTTAGAIARLPRPVDFANGRGCSRVRCEATIPVKNNTAGSLNYTGARAKKMIEGIFKTSHLRFGVKVKDNVDTALDFARLREMAIALTGDDFIVIGESGVPKRLRDVADADVLFTGVAAGASVNLVCEIVRPFEVARLAEEAYSYCPGASQMRQIEWEFVRGATVDTNGDFVQGAAADLLIIADDFESSDDKWAAVPRLYQQEEAGRTSHGPKDPVGLFAAWDYNSAGAATALTLFTIERKDDTPIHYNVRASRVVRDALYTDPIGWYDLNALVTVLHSLPADAEKHDIPTGAGFALQQTGNELNPAKTAWLYVPARSEEEIDTLVGKNVETDAGVKLISAAAKSGKGVASNIAACEPVLIVHRGAADFAALPGRVVSSAAAPVTHVPAAISAAAAAAGSTGDAETRAAGASKAASAISKAIPGWATAMRGRASVQRAGLASRFNK